MKKKIIILFIITYTLLNLPIFAADEIISSQMEALKLSSLIKEGETYTKEIFPEIELNELLNSAIKGEVNNSKIFNALIAVLGKEVVNTISTLAIIIAIIIIHSILKNFIENLNNKDSIGQIAYYVEYILIVTLIMANFSNIIEMIKNAISNLIGFINSLVPILLALMVASR